MQGGFGEGCVDGECRSGIKGLVIFDDSKYQRSTKVDG